MSGRLSDLFDELEASLKVVYDEKITFGRGAPATDEHESPPRVVWVLGSGRFSAPEKQGGRKDRSIFTRNPSIQARCWGATLDDTEQLLHEVAWAIHKAAWGSLDLVGEEWPEQAWTQHGVLVVVTFAVMTPVKEPTRRTAKATTFEADTTGSQQGDGNLDWNEP